jgi:hypothetical protein
VQFCKKCSHNLRLYIDRREWKCTTKGCNESVSIRQGTIFSQNRLPCVKVMDIARKWLNGEGVIRVSQPTGCSSKTISAYFKFMRQLVSDSIDLEDTIIGGEGIIVEVDESKLAKRKYNRGHTVEGAWVFGGVERTPERKIFLVEVADRTSETLLEIMSSHIRAGSIVYSDMWNGYSSIEKILGLRHEVINHSE